MNVINKIRAALTDTFYEVNRWFSIDAELLNYTPLNGGWNIKQILEHISLTNQYLLILIRKGTRKSLEMAAKTTYENLLAGYDLDWNKMNEVGNHGAFAWIRPRHMEPSGNVSTNEVKDRLQIQLSECIDCLDQLKNGEGILYKTMMSVNDIGKIDVYHYIYFLVQHAKRHVTQMQLIRDEFEKKS